MNQILNDYTDTTDAFLTLLESVEEKDFNTKRSDGGWSAAQIGQHMNLSHGLGELLRGNTTQTDRDPAELVPKLKSDFLNMEVKMESPDFVVPEDKVYTKQDLIQSLTEKFNDTKTAIADLDMSLTCTDFVLPQSPAMTRTEWVYFLVYHTQRHTQQLKNLKTEL